MDHHLLSVLATLWGSESWRTKRYNTFFHVLSMNTIQMVICIICMMVLCTNSNNVVILKLTIYPLNDLTVNKYYFVDLCNLHHTLVGKHSDIYSRCGISIIENFWKLEENIYRHLQYKWIWYCKQALTLTLITLKQK